MNITMVLALDNSPHPWGLVTNMTIIMDCIAEDTTTNRPDDGIAWASLKLGYHLV